MHRFRSDSESDGEPIKFDSFNNFSISSFNLSPDSASIENVFEDYNELLHGEQILSADSRVFSHTFFAKYLQVARALKPTLTSAACDLISTEYTRLRSQDITQHNIAKTQPVTARTLESLIRLSAAHAKSRINRNIDSVDVYAAISMINFAYFKELHIKTQVGSKINENISSNSAEVSNLSTHFSSKLNHQESTNSSNCESIAILSNLVSEQEFDTFKGLVFLTFSEKHTQLMKVSELLSLINNVTEGKRYTRETMLEFLYKMQECNQIMVSEEMVYLI